MTIRFTIFRPLSDHELYQKSDKELVAHIGEAKRVRNLKQAETAMHMLLYKHEKRMRNRVRSRLPDHLEHHADAVADWVLERVAKSALKLPLRGTSIGEWVNWWGTTVERQIISYWRSAQGQALEKQTQLASAREDDDDSGGIERLPDDFDEDRLIANACYTDVIEAVLAQMNDEHIAILRRAMSIWDDQPSKLVAREFGVTVDKVDKIKERFREAVREGCIDRGVSPS